MCKGGVGTTFQTKLRNLSRLARAISCPAQPSWLLVSLFERESSFFGKERKRREKIIPRALSCHSVASKRNFLAIGNSHSLRTICIPKPFFLSSFFLSFPGRQFEQHVLDTRRAHRRIGRTSRGGYIWSPYVQSGSLPRVKREPFAEEEEREKMFSVAERASRSSFSPGFKPSVPSASMGKRENRQRNYCTWKQSCHLVHFLFWGIHVLFASDHSWYKDKGKHKGKCL